MSNGEMACSRYRLGSVGDGLGPLNGFLEGARLDFVGWVGVGSGQLVGLG